PLKDVAAAINEQELEQVIRILESDLRGQFGITSPRILVCGLNPHAGEGGHLGREEIEIIEPTLARLRAEGMDLRGPLPADTLFTPKYLDHADAELAMYHDQGLPVLKYKGFGQAVNVTLGLRIIRTSVDHGTALDVARRGRAGAGRLPTALGYALATVAARRAAKCRGDAMTHPSTRDLSHPARKRFGPNFVINHGILLEIVRAIRPHKHDH